LPRADRERLRLCVIELRAQSGPLGAPCEAMLETLIAVPAAGGESEDLDARLIEKLAAAGQLRPGYLLRALERGRLGLFVEGLARLGDYDPRALLGALGSPDRPELLALACAGVGIDRGAFPTILARVRAANAGAPGGGEEGARRALGAFGPFAPEIAAEAFRRAVAAV